MMNSFGEFRKEKRSLLGLKNNQIDDRTPSYLQDSLTSFKDLAELGKNLKPKRKVFGDYVHENCVCHFPSERGSGKTLFGLQLCMAVSGNFKSYCDENIELNGNTLFLNCELNQDDLARRMAFLWKNGPKEIEQYTPYEASALTTRKSIFSIEDKVVGTIKDKEPVLLVIDNWTIAFQEADGNDKKKITEMIIKLLNLKDQYKFSILMVDHLRKGSSFKLTDSDLQSGSGAKTDLSDQDMFLRKTTDKQNRLLMRRKSRNASEQGHGKAKLLFLDPDSLWFNCLQEEVNEQDHIDFGTMKNDKEDLARYAGMMKQEGKTYKEISMILGHPISTIERWIKNK